MRHITFASENMSISAEKCRESALKYGCDESIIYTPDNFDTEFRKLNEPILSQSRGAGYWLWKPYVIKRALDTMKDGELLIYTDAGILFENHVDLMVQEMNNDVMVFGNRWRHGDWCKMDVLREMECVQFSDREQLQASCLIIRKSDYSTRFISVWLETCQKDGYIDDSESKLPNPTGWREHRHDQAILTNLVFINNIPVHWWPAQYNVRHRHNYSSKYPVMFLHHRKRNEEYK